MTLDDMITAAAQRGDGRLVPDTDDLPPADAQISADAVRTFPQATDDCDAVVYDPTGRLLCWDGPVVDLKGNR